MSRIIVLTTALTVLVAGACDTPVEPSLDEVSGLDDRAPATVAAAQHGPVAAKASGTLYRFVPVGDGSVVTVQMHVNATKHEDGTARGSYRYEAGSTVLDVDVTCMTVEDGNRAWIAGVITESTVGFVGHVSYFYTFDNGEGAQDTPDVVSLLRVEAQPGLGEAQRFCDELPTILPPRNVEQGNINVRG
jgi:hypothetical protein